MITFPIARPRRQRVALCVPCRGEGTFVRERDEIAMGVRCLYRVRAHDHIIIIFANDTLRVLYTATRAQETFVGRHRRIHSQVLRDAGPPPTRGSTESDRGSSSPRPVLYGRDMIGGVEDGFAAHGG